MRKTDEIFVRAMFVDEKNGKSLRSFIVEAVWWFLLVWSFNLTLQPQRLFNHYKKKFRTATKSSETLSSQKICDG